jgi:hypothetical protein
MCLLFRDGFFNGGVTVLAIARRRSTSERTVAGDPLVAEK